MTIPQYHPLTPPPSPTQKASFTSPDSPTPKPLRIFKRASRKFSFQHLSPDAPLSTIKEPQPLDLRHISFSSIDCQISPADPRVGGNSSLTFLPTPPPSDASDDDGDSYGNENAEHGSLHDDTDERVPLVTSTAALSTAIGHVKRKASNLAANLNNSTPIHRCALCKNPLQSALKTYAFPRTAPTVLTALRARFPDLEIPIDGPLPSATPSPTRSGHGIKRRVLTPFPLASSACNSKGVAATTTNTTNPLGSAPSGTAMDGASSWLGIPRLRSPEFCLTCFEQLHALHMCWTCGETVERAEERVGCGWAWWHWGCMACLLCRAPIAPPAWTSYPIALSEPPACRACLRELRELVAIERRKISDCRRRCYSPVPTTANDMLVVPSSSAPSVTAAAPYYPRCHFLPAATAASSRHGTMTATTTQHRDRTYDDANDDGSNDDGDDGTSTGSSTIRPTATATANGPQRKRSSSGRNGAMWAASNTPRDVVVEEGLHGAGMDRVKRYPPLPKWMDKLPGRRGGGAVGVGVGYRGPAAAALTGTDAGAGAGAGGYMP